MNGNLDEALKRWAAKTRPDEERLQKLADEIVASASRENARAIPIGAESRLPGLWRLRFVYACLGAVAALLVVMVFHAPRPSNQSEADGPEVAQVSRENLEAKGLLYSELDRLFPHRLKWFAEQEGHVALSVASQKLPGGASGRPLITEISVITRKSADSAWKEIWSASIIARNQELVEINLGPGKAKDLSLWMYLLPDGMVLVETEMSLDQPVHLTTSTSTIMRKGATSRVLTVKLQDQEFRVLQTVDDLLRIASK